MRSLWLPLLAFWFASRAAAAQPPITALAFSPDGRQLLSGSQAGIEIYSWPQLERERTLDLQLPEVHDLVFSTDGRRLAAAGGRASEYGELVVCDWPAGQVLWRVVAHDDVIYGLDWNDTNGLLATAGADQLVTCVSSEGHVEQRLTGHSRPVLAAVFLPGGSQLVTAGMDRSLRVWDTTAGTLLRHLDNHTEPVRDLALRPIENVLPMLASIGADRTVRFWQPTIGRLVRFVRIPAEPLSVAWTPEGRSVAVGCVDGHVRVIDHETLVLERDQQAIDGWAYEVAVPPGNEALVVAGSNQQIARVVVHPRGETPSER